MLGCTTHGYQFIEAVCTKCRDTALGQSTEIDRLRAKLAKARLERDNIAALNSSLIAEHAKAEAMDRLCYTADECDLVTACEHWVANFHEADARAERAEAELKAMRSLLVDTLPDLEAAANIHRSDSLLKRVRTALRRA